MLRPIASLFSCLPPSIGCRTFQRAFGPPEMEHLQDQKVLKFSIPCDNPKCRLSMRQKSVFFCSGLDQLAIRMRHNGCNAPSFQARGAAQGPLCFLGFTPCFPWNWVWSHQSGRVPSFPPLQGSTVPCRRKRKKKGNLHCRGARARKQPR